MICIITVSASLNNTAIKQCGTSSHAAVKFHVKTSHAAVVCTWKAHDYDSSPTAALIGDSTRGFPGSVLLSGCVCVYMVWARRAA